MSSHEKHPSVAALNAKKQVSQVKQLFENYNQLNQTNITNNNEFINYCTPREKRKNESIEIIIGHSSDNRSISTWLEISDDDYNDTESINNDITNNIDNDDIDVECECDNEQILEISATLTLSPSYGKGEYDTIYYNTILPIQQSITSPININNKSIKPFTFEQEYINNNNNTNNIQKQKKIKEYKSIINDKKKEHKTKDSLIILQNKICKKETNQSLITLQNKKLVNNGLKYCILDENKEDNDEFTIDDNVDNRQLPIWLTNDIKEKKKINKNGIDNKHMRELTDVLD